MAQPASRSQLKDYCLRQLGAPVLEINVADEQIDDIIDDALQYFHERHFDGVLRTYLKYQVTQDDIDRGKGPGQSGVTGIQQPLQHQLLMVLQCSLIGKKIVITYKFHLR